MPRTSTRSGRSAVACEPLPPIALVATEERRERIGGVLEEEGLEFVAFEEVDDLLEGHVVEAPGLVLLWIEDGTTLSASRIEPLLRSLEGMQVVLLCAEIQRWEMRAALAGGAVGVVLEDRMEEALGPCLHAVWAGHICVPRRHWRQIEPPALSTREKQILGLVVMGFMNGQIAERLFLAESTVKSHLSSAFGKLGVRSRNEAVKLILDSKQGLGMGILALGGEPLESEPGH